MAFLSAIVLEIPTARRPDWVVARKAVYVGSLGDRFEIPAGFLTDLASVPRIAWPLLPPFGAYVAAAILHDYLYRFAPSVAAGRWPERRLFRWEADGIFRRAMREDGVSWPVRRAMFYGVRCGGGCAWRRYRKAERCSPTC